MAETFKSLKACAKTMADDKRERYRAGGVIRALEEERKMDRDTAGRGEGKVLPGADGTQGKAKGGYADDFTRDGKSVNDVDGKKPKPRLDRKAYKNGGAVKGKATTVNVIVAPGGAAQPPPMPATPSPPAAAGPMPPLPAGAGPAAPNPMMPPPGMRANGGLAYKNGGFVKMENGAQSGEGRLEKIAKYGKNAKP
ncbi:MAG: hypothetical protein J0I45_16345 [Bosea sp.]|nr:hypothetical protein [Bosea sp. (in: a-proteobacteria)]